MGGRGGRLSACPGVWVPHVTVAPGTRGDPLVSNTPRPPCGRSACDGSSPGVATLATRWRALYDRGDGGGTPPCSAAATEPRLTGEPTGRGEWGVCVALRAVRVGGFGGRGSPAISSWRPPPPLPLPPPLPPVDCCVGGGRGGPTVARRLADDPTLPSSESHAEAVPRTTGDARATPGINVLLACRRTRNWSTRARRVASSCACISASASTCTTHRAAVSPCTRPCDCRTYQHSPQAGGCMALQQPVASTAAPSEHRRGCWAPVRAPATPRPCSQSQTRAIARTQSGCWCQHQLAPQWTPAAQGHQALVVVVVTRMVHLPPAWLWRRVRWCCRQGGGWSCQRTCRRCLLAVRLLAWSLACQALAHCHLSVPTGGQHGWPVFAPPSVQPQRSRMQSPPTRLWPHASQTRTERRGR